MAQNIRVGVVVEALIVEAVFLSIAIVEDDVDATVDSVWDIGILLPGEWMNDFSQAYL